MPRPSHGNARLEEAALTPRLRTRHRIDQQGCGRAIDAVWIVIKEIELKLRVTRRYRRSQISELCDCTSDPTYEQLDLVYFDSDDRALRDHGLTLRVRHIGDKRVQTIKTSNRGSFD